LNLFKAALLGILQGLTEFLPVSSTAHLLIGSRLIGWRSGRCLHGDDPARFDLRGDVAAREDPVGDCRIAVEP
jgi:undecaprenyl pyrophosphate phosphatase UppP